MVMKRLTLLLIVMKKFSEFYMNNVEDDEDQEEEWGRRRREVKKKIRYGWFHCNILWTCNQTIIIILKILDIKKLTARTKVDNDRRHKGPV